MNRQFGAEGLTATGAEEGGGPIVLGMSCNCHAPGITGVQTSDPLGFRP